MPTRRPYSWKKKCGQSRARHAKSHSRLHFASPGKASRLSSGALSGLSPRRGLQVPVIRLAACVSLRSSNYCRLILASEVRRQEVAALLHLCLLSFNDDLGTPPTWRPCSWKKNCRWGSTYTGYVWKMFKCQCGSVGVPVYVSECLMWKCRV